MKTQLEGPYVLYQGKKMLDFSSQDFLGLSQHPEVKKNAIKYVLRYGIGPSPFLQQQVEDKLAHFLGKKEAALFPALEPVTGVDLTDIFGIEDTKLQAPTVFGSLEKGGGCPLSFVASSLPIANRKWGISSALLGALDAALNFIPEMDDERQLLKQKREWLSKILPSSLSEKAKEVFTEFEIYVEGPISVTVLHTPDDLDQLTRALKKLSETDLALATQSLTPAP